MITRQITRQADLDEWWETAVQNPKIMRYWSFNDYQEAPAVETSNWIKTYFRLKDAILIFRIDRGDSTCSISLFNHGLPLLKHDWKELGLRIKSLISNPRFRYVEIAVSSTNTPCIKILKKLGADPQFEIKENAWDTKLAEWVDTIHYRLKPAHLTSMINKTEQQTP